jgi:hypothetical protein
MQQELPGDTLSPFSALMVWAVVRVSAPLSTGAHVLASFCKPGGQGLLVDILYSAWVLIIKSVTGFHYLVC